MLLRTLLIPIILGVVQFFIAHCCIGRDVQPLLRAHVTMLEAVPGGTPVNPIGSIDFVQRGDMVMISGTMSGLTPGLHGIHVHEKGNLGNGCLDAGGHFNPFNMDHGAPSDRVRHVGDLGNIITPDNGDTVISIKDTMIKLNGPQSVIGLALVIHAAGDDLNRGNSPLSRITGNAGGRVSCGIIELV